MGKTEVVSVPFETDFLNAIDEFIAEQPVKSARTEFIRTACRDFLEKHKKKGE